MTHSICALVVQSQRSYASRWRHARHALSLTIVALVVFALICDANALHHEPHLNPVYGDHCAHSPAATAMKARQRPSREGLTRIVEEDSLRPQSDLTPESPPPRSTAAVRAAR